jgi:hypothetical protein
MYGPREWVMFFICMALWIIVIAAGISIINRIKRQQCLNRKRETPTR